MKNLTEAIKWEGLYEWLECDRFGISRSQLLTVICCYEVVRPRTDTGVIT